MRWFTLAEASKYLGISETQLREAVRVGKLRAWRDMQGGLIFSIKALKGFERTHGTSYEQ